MFSQRRDPTLERRCDNGSRFDPSWAAFEIRPFRLSETTKMWRTINSYHEEGYFHITLLFKNIYKSSDCHG